MIDREKVLLVLRRRFPGASAGQLAAAANAIMSLREEWEEVPVDEALLGWPVALACRDSVLAAQLQHGVQIRIFKNRPPDLTPAVPDDPAQF